MINSYSVINTDAYIIHTRASGEADKIITFLTKDNGIVNVFAKSIRKESAKMRYMVKPYARVHISIIAGRKNILKNIFITDPYVELWNSKERYTAFVILLRSISSFIPITEHNEKEIFSIIENASILLRDEDVEIIPNILLVAQASILEKLGYIENDVKKDYTLKDVVKEVSESRNLNQKMQRDFKNALMHIN